MYNFFCRKKLFAIKIKHSNINKSEKETLFLNNYSFVNKEKHRQKSTRSFSLKLHAFEVSQFMDSLNVRGPLLV